MLHGGWSWATPPFSILRAAYGEYVVTDLERARSFYVDLLGFVVTERSDQALYLRGYEERYHHSFVLRRGDTPHVARFGFRVGSPDDLDVLARRFEELGCALRWIDGQEPGVGRVLRVRDPLGFPVEFVHELEQVDRLLQRFDLYRGAEIMRLDHFNLHVPDVDRAFDHYRSLGFRCSEYTSTDPPDERIWAAWMFRKPDVHDVALMAGAGPRLHHLGFWVADTTSVLRACDMLAGAGRSDAIERGPGRHGLSNAFFLYLRDPDGHRIELYTGDYYTGDPDFEPIRWSVNDPRRGTFWGHQAPASWFEDSSLVADLDGNVVEPVPTALKQRPRTVT